MELEWEGNATNDAIADAVMAVLLTIESSPAAVKHSSKAHSHNHAQSNEYDSFGGSPVEENPPSDFASLSTTKTNGVNLVHRPNPLANLTPEEKLNRLFMFLEAQFGEEAITPIAQPKLPAPSKDDEDEAEVDHEKAIAAELARLHALGIPVPGLEIRVDKNVATVWLEKLEVECANKSFLDRVKKVVERGGEVVAPLWQ